MKRRRIRRPSRIAKTSLQKAGRTNAHRGYTAPSRAMGSPVMHQPATTPIGPPGSTIHVLHAGAGAIAELAAIDWNRHFRRACLDPARGLAPPMAPSNLHEGLTRIFDDVVGAAGSTPAGASKGLRSLRLRGRGEPPGAGMEPDRAFCAGERASGRCAALAEGEAAPDTFVERTAPDLVVEVEITHTDAGKAERYGEMEGREPWRLYGRKGAGELRAELVTRRPAREVTTPAARGSRSRPA